MRTLWLIVKCVLSALLGAFCGYLIGLVFGALLKVVPFIRVGSLEVRGNLIGVVLGALIAALTARSTYKREIQRLCAGGQNN